MIWIPSVCASVPIEACCRSSSVAANLMVDREHWLCVGQEINANHLRRAPEGSVVTGTARAFHIGARSQVWGVEICDGQGQRVCVSRVTMAVVKR